MGLSLVVGPAHVGKVALLLERYLAVLEHDPWLVVPNRVDVDRVERDLVRRRPALLAGTVGTFDDLFRHVAGADADGMPVASEIQRTLAVRRAVERVQLGELSSSAATAGFADTLLQAIGELESGLVDASQLDGDLPVLAAAYREELETLGLQDRDGLRRHAVERLRGDLDAWSGEPVFAYGFEDLTGAEWALLEALSARADVTVSIPYEPGRAAFEALERTVDDLAGLAQGAIEELPRASASTSARGAGAARARALLRRAGARPAARRRDSLPGRRGSTRHRRAARERARGSSARRDGSRARRRRLRVRRSLARAARERALAARRALLDRARATPRRRAARTCAGLRAPIRLARRRSRRSLRLPALAVLGPRTSVGGLRRRTPSGPGRRRSCTRRRGERTPARRARPGARRAQSRGRSGRSRPSVSSR